VINKAQAKSEFICFYLIPFIECQDTAEGLANNGLKLSISTVLTKCKDTLGKFYQTAKVPADKTAMINLDDLVHTCNYTLVFPFLTQQIA